MEYPRETRRVANLTQPEETARLFASGQALFDVPFSLADGKRIIRGTIDALIRRPDGSITVIALQTGAPVPKHEQRLALILDAARQMFPTATVNGRSLYWNP